MIYSVLECWFSKPIIPIKWDVFIQKTHKSRLWIHQLVKMWPQVHRNLTLYFPQGQWFSENPAFTVRFYKS
jgi:hypothetical protein